MRRGDYTRVGAPGGGITGDHPSDDLPSDHTGKLHKCDILQFICVNTISGRTRTGWKNK